MNKCEGFLGLNFPCLFTIANVMLILNVCLLSGFGKVFSDVHICYGTVSTLSADGGQILQGPERDETPSPDLWMSP